MLRGTVVEFDEAKGLLNGPLQLRVAPLGHVGGEAGQGGVVVTQCRRQVVEPVEVEHAGQEEAGAKFADYFDYVEPINKIPSHRALAHAPAGGTARRLRAAAPGGGPRGDRCLDHRGYRRRRDPRR